MTYPSSSEMKEFLSVCPDECAHPYCWSQKSAPEEQKGETPTCYIQHHLEVPRWKEYLEFEGLNQSSQEARPLPARPQEHVLFEGMARVYDKSEADAYMDALEAQLSRQWIDCPDSQGWWWHFYDGAAVPFSYGVLASHTGPQVRYFIQYPDIRWCDEVGGKWLKIVEPAPPISPDKEGQ